MTGNASTTGTAGTGQFGVSPDEARPRALMPYLCVDEGRRALDWYPRALGARILGEPIVMDDDRIGHAELAFGDCMVLLAEEFPELGVLSPRSRGGTTVSLRLEVPDADATIARAVELGAELTRAVTDAPYGRGGVINDPFGHRWMINTSPQRR